MPKKKPNGSAASDKAPVSKTQFILSIPFTTPADEVVAKAAESGLELTKQYVYTIRTKNKAGAKAKRRGRASSKSKASAASAPKAKAASSRGGSFDDEFADLIAQIGLVRAEQILKNVRAKFHSVAH